MFKHIPIAGNQVVIVDNDDYEMLIGMGKWYAQKGRDTFYAMKTAWDKWPEKCHRIIMHRIITNCPDDKQVDHINKNGLDNRKENLRICNISQNKANARYFNKTGYRGITPRGNGFVSQIVFQRKLIYLGYYCTMEEAARAYDKAAINLHGEFATLNFPQTK